MKRGKLNLELMTIHIDSGNGVVNDPALLITDTTVDQFHVSSKKMIEKIMIENLNGESMCQLEINKFEYILKLVNKNNFCLIRFLFSDHEAPYVMILL